MRFTHSIARGLATNNVKSQALAPLSRYRRKTPRNALHSWNSVEFLRKNDWIRASTFNSRSCVTVCNCTESEAAHGCSDCQSPIKVDVELTVVDMKGAPLEVHSQLSISMKWMGIRISVLKQQKVPSWLLKKHVCIKSLHL